MYLGTFERGLFLNLDTKEVYFEHGYKIFIIPYSKEIKDINKYEIKSFN